MSLKVKSKSYVALLALLSLLLSFAACLLVAANPDFGTAAATTAACGPCPATA